MLYVGNLHCKVHHLRGEIRKHIRREWSGPAPMNLRPIITQITGRVVVIASLRCPGVVGNMDAIHGNDRAAQEIERTIILLRLNTLPKVTSGTGSSSAPRGAYRNANRRMLQPLRPTIGIFLLFAATFVAGSDAGRALAAPNVTTIFARDSLSRHRNQPKNVTRLQRSTIIKPQSFPTEFYLPRFGTLRIKSSTLSERSRPQLLKP